MATNEQRTLIRVAIQRAERSLGISVTTEAENLFIERVVQHIEGRYLNSENRNNEFLKATRETERLLKNISSFTGSNQIDLASSRNFIQKSVNCFYPFCKP